MQINLRHCDGRTLWSGEARNVADAARQAARTGKLRRGNLSGADLSGADLGEADLRRANLSGANLSGANLSGADLSEADLRRANLSGADLSGADLGEADLRRANLSGADLSGADLSRADLRRADLSRVNLSWANLSGANLSGVNLDEIFEIQIPVIPQIDRKMQGALVSWGRLDMSRYHSCDTTHCRAGFAVHLAGEAGYALEQLVGPNVAGALIYAASRPKEQVPDFYASCQVALTDIRACAARQ
jgi:hypothetical protein